MKPETVEEGAGNALPPGRIVCPTGRELRARRNPALPAGSARPAPVRARSSGESSGLLRSAFALVAVLMLVSLVRNAWDGWHGSWVRRARVVSPPPDWWKKSPGEVDHQPDGLVANARPGVPASAVQDSNRAAVEETAPDPPDPNRGARLSVGKWRRVYADGAHEDPWVNTYWSGVVALPPPDSTQLALHGPVVAAFVLEENPMNEVGVTPAVGAEECTWRCFFEDGFMLSLPPFVENTGMALEYGAGWATSPPIEVTASSGTRFHLPADGAKLREDHGAIRAVATCEWLRTNRAPVEQARRD